MVIKQLVAGAARRLGYTVVPTWRLASYPVATHTSRLFRLLGVDLVIDVGANCGQFYDPMRDHVGFAGRMLSFEPVPDLASALLARASADPLWSVDTRALAATPGKARFNVMEDRQFSSFRSPRHDAVSMFEQTNRVHEHVMVEMTTLDAVLPPLMAAHQPRSVYLKLDTQGFDMDNDGQFPEMVEFDCVMIRPDRAAACAQASSAM